MTESHHSVHIVQRKSAFQKEKFLLFNKEIDDSYGLLQLQTETAASFCLIISEAVQNPKRPSPEYVFIASGVEFCCGASWTVAFPLDLWLSLSLRPTKAWISKLILQINENHMKDIRKTYFSEVKTELFHRKYAVLYGFAVTSLIPTIVSNALSWPVTFSVEPLQTLFCLVMSTFRAEDSLKKNYKQTPWSPVINHKVSSLVEKTRIARKARCFPSMERLLNYIKNDIGRVWSAKQRVELYIRVGSV